MCSLLVQCLPNETLATIFELSLPDSQPMGLFNSQSLALTRVCRRWRSTAIADPWLWTDISLSTTDLLFPKFLLVIWYWLRHSHSLSPTITLRLQFDRKVAMLPTKRLNIAPAIRLLSAELHRCRSLELHTDDTLLFPSIFKLLLAGRFALAQLENILLHSAIPHIGHSVPLDIPNLRSLVTSCPEMLLAKQLQTIGKFPFLHQFSISNVDSSATKVLAFLKTLPQLKLVCLAFNELRPSVPDDRLVMPSLASLSLNSRSPSASFRRLLAQLDLPALVSLSVNTGHIGFEPFIFSNLLCLELENIAITFTHSPWEKLNNLESLTMRRCPDVGRLIEFLVGHHYVIAEPNDPYKVLRNLWKWLTRAHYKINENIPCPRLGTVVIVGLGIYPLRSAIDLLDLILSRGGPKGNKPQLLRAKMPRRLEVVSLTVDESCRDIYHHLRNLEGYGVEIYGAEWRHDIFPNGFRLVEAIALGLALFMSLFIFVLPIMAVDYCEKLFKKYIGRD